MSTVKDRAKEIQEAFEFTDKPQEGVVTEKELNQIIKSLYQEDNDEDDINNDGQINYEDYIALMNKRNKEVESEEEIINAFKILDKDGQGVISVTELRHIMTSVGDLLTEEEVDSMIKKADYDANGYINYEEFIRMMMG